MFISKIHSFFFLVLLSYLLLSACTEKPSVAFSISGHINNPRTGKIVLMQEVDVNQKKKKLVDVIPVDEKGNFNIDLDLEPHIYTLNFYDEKSVTLAIDRGQKIKIKADGNDLADIKVTGSEDTAKLEAYEKFRSESLERLVKTVRKDLENSDDVNNPDAEQAGLAEIENYEKHKTELNDFIKAKMGDSIAIYATSLRWDGAENIPFFESLEASFEKKHGDLEITKRIKEKITLLKKTSVGGSAEAVTIPDKDGKEIEFKASKAKYTLIDFWASWCGPCRRESRSLSKLLTKHQANGFAIYGISLDDDREKWLNALEKDGRTWTNVSSLKGYETKAAFDYGVTALPANFLIDSEGKIVAKNLHGRELVEKVNEVFSK